MLTQKTKTCNNSSNTETIATKETTLIEKTETRDNARKKLDNLSSNNKTNCKGKKGFATPNSNTGSNLTDSLKAPHTKVDWLSLNGKKITFENVNQIIVNLVDGKLFNKKYEYKEYDCHFAIFRGGTPFEKTFKNQLGVTVHVKYSEEYNNYEIQVKFSGSVLSELVGLSNHLLEGKITKFARSVGLHSSRIDLAINDYQKRLSPEDLLEWTEQGYLCKYFTAKYIKSWSGKKNYWCSTINFGSRQSNVSLKVYDMFIEHGIVGNRWELELHDKKARLVENVLIAEYENYENEIAEKKANNETIDYKEIEDKYNCILIKYILNVILSSIDFKDKEQVGSNGNIGKVASLEKFQAFRRYINQDYERIPLKVEVKETDLMGNFQWLIKSVKGAMSRLRDGLGVQMFRKIEKLLYTLDKQKTKPSIIQKDNELMIAELKAKGINAIMTNEQIKEYSEKTGIDFGLIHTELNHEDKWPKMIKSKQLREFNKQSDIFGKLLKTDITGLYWIYEYLPTEFENIIRHFKPIEQQQIIELYTT
jgi:DNA relaxase NicK